MKIELELPPLWRAHQSVVTGRATGKTMRNVRAMQLHLMFYNRPIYLLCPAWAAARYAYFFKIHALGNDRWMVYEMYPAEYTRFLMSGEDE